MNPEDVIAVLKEIGTLLEPTAQAAWEIAMRQVHVEAIQLMWGAILAGVIALICTISIIVVNSEHGYDDPIGQWFGVLLAVPTAFVCASGAYGRMVNPAYYVISWLLKLVP